MAREGEIRLEQAEYRLLRDLFNEHCGISFGPEARPILERRLRERLSALGLQSFSEYYQMLRFDERGKLELEEAIDLITINETYFFRELYQLRCYKDEILPMLRHGPNGRERLAIWSAGCSTGEEVYSIAMLTREAGTFLDRTVRIFGSDIARHCVTAARRGVYGSSSFRTTPADLKKRYFIERADGMHVVDELRSMCQFGQLNLLDASRASIVGRVDVIFCRNVLIYFDENSRRRVIEMFYERLLPGGFLLLGHSESLLNISTAFELVHLREDLVYRKPLSSTRFQGGVSLRPLGLRDASVGRTQEEWSPPEAAGRWDEWSSASPLAVTTSLGLRSPSLPNEITRSVGPSTPAAPPTPSASTPPRSTEPSPSGSSPAPRLTDPKPVPPVANERGERR